MTVKRDNGETPDRLIVFNGEITAEEADKFRRRFHEAMAHGRVTIWPPLPRRVRLRLWLTHQVDGAAIWLVEHERTSAAVALWRVCGMWR